MAMDSDVMLKMVLLVLIALALVGAMFTGGD